MKSVSYYSKKVIEGVAFGAIPVCIIYLILVALGFFLGGSDVPEMGSPWNIKGNEQFSGFAESFFPPLIALPIAWRAATRIPMAKKPAESFTLMPWRIGKPLPGGPFYFSLRLWTALLSLSLLGFLILGTSLWKWFALAICVHVFIAGMLLIVSKRFWPLTYALILAVLTLLFFSSGSWWICGLGIVLCWPVSRLVLQALQDGEFRIDWNRLKPTPMAWPASQLAPNASPGRILRTGEWLLLSSVFALAATWVVRDEHSSIALSLLFVVSLALLNLCRYLKHKLPPIPVIGRIFRGPPIIPAYDRVFLPFILNIALSAAAFIVCHYSPESWHHWIAGLTVFLGSTVNFRLFPSWTYWDLVAPGRLPSSFTQKANGMQSI